MQNRVKTKVFFFANIPVSDERSMGGTTVTSGEILTFLLAKKQLEVKHHQIRKSWKPKFQIPSYIGWLFKFPIYIRKFDAVSFHTTKDVHFTIAPFLWIWSKLLKKRVVYHIYGGEFHLQYQKLPKIFQKILDKTILSSDKVFLETKEIVRFFSETRDGNFEWLPNARPPQKKIILDKKKPFRKKFVYLSRIIPEKGINEILKASMKLPEEYTIDIYGPIDERYFTEPQLSSSNANYYNKVIRFSDVPALLNEYDVLLLPTYFKGEGYPGIILDSLALGIPVITTNWKAIPEIIEENFNGKLIKPKNVEELTQAILFFNEENIVQFRLNAFKSFQQFNSELVFEKIVSAYG